MQVLTVLTHQTFWYRPAVDGVRIITPLDAVPTISIKDKATMAVRDPSSAFVWDAGELAYRLTFGPTDVPLLSELETWLAHVTWEKDLDQYVDEEVFEIRVGGQEYRYGRVRAVSEMLRALVTLTTTSPVTLADVADELAGVSAGFDLRLHSVGYVTPVEAVRALQILDRAANLYTASAAYERLVLARDPTTNRVETAAIWRNQADTLLAPIWAREADLPDAERLPVGSGGLSDTPTVSSRATAFDPDASDDFNAAYGSGFAGAGVD